MVKGAGILFKNEIKDPFKWIIISLSIVGFLFLLKNWNPLFFAYFLSAFLISLFGYSYQNKDWFPFFSLGLPFLLLIFSLFNNLGKQKDLIILLQILIFGGMILRYGGYLFEKIWNYRDGFIKSKWNNLEKESLRKRYFEVAFGIYSLLFFHLSLVILSLISNQGLFLKEQIGITSLFFVMSVWFFKNRKIIPSQPKKIASATFFLIVIMIIFDIILAQIISLNDKTILSGFIWGIIIGIVSLIRIMINPTYSKFTTSSPLSASPNSALKNLSSIGDENR
ncbi:MAG: hypothetical protein WC438_00080 [Candidatus Pacearchaeota archaeon]